MDVAFPFTVACAANPTGANPTTVGATCTVLTRANAVMPGSIVGGIRSNWELGAIQVYDGGADGQASTADNTLFESQGVFIP
jgi:hypothetical protein